MPSANGTNGYNPTKALTLPPIYTAAQLRVLEFPDPKWAIPGICPEGLSILCGAPKMGKSWMALGLCIAIATGGVALGHVQVEQGDVLYLALEDRWRRLKGRMDSLCQNGAWPERLQLATTWPRQGRGGLELIGMWLEEHKDARLVVIDTLAKFRRQQDRPGGSQYDEDYQVGEWIKHTADKFGVAIVIIHHFRKMQSDDPLEQISGTFGLTGAADGVLLLQRQRGRADATLIVDGRDVENQELAMKWDPALKTWTLIGTAEDYKLSKERSEIVKLLQKSDQALTPKDVAGMLQKNGSTVKTMMWEMSKLGQIKSVGDGRYMALNQGNPGGAGLPAAPVNMGNLGNQGNPVGPVAQVAQVAPVAGVAQTHHSEGAMLCLDCKRELPDGWLFRCPDCEEKRREREMQDV